MYLTDKKKIKRFADMIEAMPKSGEFVVLFDQGEIHNLAGERIASFGMTLFDRAYPVNQSTDGDSALEAIEESPVRGTDSYNYVAEKH